MLKKIRNCLGVGNDTDMFIIEYISDDNCATFMVKDDKIYKIDKVYKNLIKKEVNIHGLAKREVERYVEETQKAASEQEPKA